MAGTPAASRGWGCVSYSSNTQSPQKRANFAIGGTTEHLRRLLVCFAGCSRLVTGECPDDPLTLRIPETTWMKLVENVFG